MTEPPLRPFDESTHEPRASIVEAAVGRGRDAMAFLAVEYGMRHWVDAPAPEGTGAYVAYVPTSGAWVAACSPLIEAPAEAFHSELARAALRFVDAARARGFRACFFGCEALQGDTLQRQLVGEQPVFRPSEWLHALPGRRRLREQLRRARAKGLVVRAVGPGELDDASPLRADVERLAEGWLRSRHIEPMRFLVALEPFHFPPEHRYFVAELEGRTVAFLSAVPIGACGAWLVEDVIRSAEAPNGTAETLLVALFHEVEDSAYVTLGLTPLAGKIAWPLRFARWVSRPLFDFEGLRAFRERLRPDAWEPVWLVYPRGQLPLLPVVDSLRAFAGGSLVGFAARSFVRHPSGLPWALALPLPLWVVALAGLEATHEGALLGFHPVALGLWTAFDALLLVILVRAALRPQRTRLLLATSLAFGDGLVSAAHLSRVGFGPTPLHALLRTLATIAPLAGALLLGWATTRTAPVARSDAAGSTQRRPLETGAAP